MLLAQNSRRAADRKAPIPMSWCTGKTQASPQGKGPEVSVSTPVGMESLRQAIRAGLQRFLDPLLQGKVSKKVVFPL